MVHSANGTKVLNKLSDVKHSEKLIYSYVLIGPMHVEVLVLGFRNYYLHIGTNSFISLESLSFCQRKKISVQGIVWAGLGQQEARGSVRIN